MGRSSRSRQVGLVVAGVSILLGVGLGFWPVSVNVVGDISYSCGSGFIHSGGTWKADTKAMGAPGLSVGLSSATPNSACPARVYRHRDIAYVLIALAAITYAALLATAGSTRLPHP